MASSCFNNQTMQLVHKYADGVLLLLIAALSWWLINLSAQVDRLRDRGQVVLADALSARERSEAILKRLDQIDLRLLTIDQRIYALFGQRYREERLQ